MSKGLSLEEPGVSGNQYLVTDGANQEGRVGNAWNSDASQRMELKVEQVECAYSNRSESENIAIAALEALYAD